MNPWKQRKFHRNSFIVNNSFSLKKYFSQIHNFFLNPSKYETRVRLFICPCRVRHRDKVWWKKSTYAYYDIKFFFKLIAYESVHTERYHTFATVIIKHKNRWFDVSKFISIKWLKKNWNKKVAAGATHDFWKLSSVIAINQWY